MSSLVRRALLLLVGAVLVCRTLQIEEAHFPCFPQPVSDVVTDNGVTRAVNMTFCGDKGVGNQSLWWRAVEPDDTCFGLSRPGHHCSKSTTNNFHCLVGEKWDDIRLRLNYPKEQRERTARIEVGNWYSMSLQGAVGRIVLEEVMNFKVEVVARIGTFGAYERTARSGDYLSLEAWSSSSYRLADKYYARSEVIPKPFVDETNGIAYAVNRSVLLDWQPPNQALRQQVLDIEERPIFANLLGATGTVGIFVNRPAVEQSDASAVVEFWRGLRNERALALFPPDGTIKCKDRLRSGSSCTDPQARFYCDKNCPSELWGGTTACCFHGKFYPPQCIPEGVTREDIMADPEWASPYCREFIHPDATWDVAYFEAVIVNLRLNFTVSYLGLENSQELVKSRTAAGIPTIFYWWEPDVLVETVGASLLLLPAFSTTCGDSYDRDPLKSGINCQQEVVHFNKLISAEVKENNEDLFRFWDKYTLSNEDYSSLLALHVAGGGSNATVDEAACEWLKQVGEARFFRWVQNTQTSSNSFDSTTLALALVFPLMAFLLVTLLIARFWIHHSQNMHTKLPWKEIEFANPPILLHRSLEGLVIMKAKYQGQPVTVKELVCKKESAGTQFWPTHFTGFFCCRRVENVADDPLDLQGVSEFVIMGKHDESSYLESILTASATEAELHSNSLKPLPSMDLEDPIGKTSFDASHLKTVNGGVLEDMTRGEQVRIQIAETENGNDQRVSLASALEEAQEDTPTWNQIRTQNRTMSVSPEDLKKLRAHAAFGTFRRSLEAIGLHKPKKEIANELLLVDKSALVKEMAQITQLRHNNLIQYYGHTTSSSNKLVIVYEYMEGSLQQIIHNPTIALDHEILLSMTKDIASVMEYLHTRSNVMVHGNLISSSILVDTNFSVKVADLVKTGRKPSIYNAPEVLIGGLPDTKTDVWFFGILLYELFSRKIPFAEEDEENFDGATIRRNSGVLPKLPIMSLNEINCRNAVVRKICLACQAVDPVDRPSLAEINKQLSHIETSTLANKMNQLLEKKKLLHDILPEHVAATLSAGKKVKPELYESITLFFSDIVGFTTISQQLQPMDVMALLDRLYGDFDKLSRRHELYKVETIGDAYMCAGNLLKSQPDHAVRVVQFAKGTIEVAQKTLVHPSRPDMGTVNIRVGLHTGPAVASVVGQTNPRYCLFGDTVNTASKLESLSEANCIHLSATTALKLSNDFGVRLIPRGVVNVKGTGEMETFWVKDYAPKRQRNSSQFSTVREEELPQELPRKKSSFRGKGRTVSSTW